MGPSGNGLVERMKAGETPWNQGRSNGRPCPFPEGGPEDEGKRRSGAPRGERPTSLGVRRKAFEMLTRAFRRSAPSRCVRGDLPSMSEGTEMPGAPRALREQGRRSFGHLLAGCVKYESDISQAGGRTNARSA